MRLNDMKCLCQRAKSERWRNKKCFVDIYRLEISQQISWWEVLQPRWLWDDPINRNNMQWCFLHMILCICISCFFFIVSLIDFTFLNPCAMWDGRWSVLLKVTRSALFAVFPVLFLFVSCRRGHAWWHQKHRYLIIFPLTLTECRSKNKILIFAKFRWQYMTAGFMDV